MAQFSSDAQTIGVLHYITTLAGNFLAMEQEKSQNMSISSQIFSKLPIFYKKSVHLSCMYCLYEIHIEEKSFVGSKHFIPRLGFDFRGYLSQDKSRICHNGNLSAVCLGAIRHSELWVGKVPHIRVFDIGCDILDLLQNRFGPRGAWRKGGWQGYYGGNVTRQHVLAHVFPGSFTLLRFGMVVDVAHPSHSRVQIRCGCVPSVHDCRAWTRARVRLVQDPAEKAAESGQVWKMSL